MCEFCTKHGEGKKWYMQMKNYSDELLHVELPKRQKEAVGVKNRLEWHEKFFKGFINPAITGIEPEREKKPEAEVEKPSDEDVVRNRKIGHFAQVIPIEDVEKVLDIVDSITRFPCGCRYYSIGKTDKRYCFGFAMDKWGVLGKFPDAASSLERLEKEEAKKIMGEYDKEGLLHTIWTDVAPHIAAICNCDRDCLPYRGYIENNGLQCFFRAEYVGKVDWDKCTGCKTCMSQCQFGAMFYSSALSKVFIKPEKCFGCGVCRAACKHEAISLKPRQEIPEAADVW